MSAAARGGGLYPVLGATEMLVSYRLYRRHNPDIVIPDLAMGSGAACCASLDSLN
jgi:hypothetical protein